jgi:hypothetical protein
MLDLVRLDGLSNANMSVVTTATTMIEVAVLPKDFTNGNSITQIIILIIVLAIVGVEVGTSIIIIITLHLPRMDVAGTPTVITATATPVATPSQ